MSVNYWGKEKRFLKSISINGLLKPLSMIVSLAYTPTLLRFLGDEQYGVWSTMLSVMNWVTIFDFGIAGGYRNLLSVKIAQKDDQGIREVSSTAYLFLSVIVTALFGILLIVNFFTKWDKIFNTALNVRPAVIFVIIFVCLNFIFGLTNSIFYSLQKSQYVPIISLLFQTLNLINIYVLNRFSFFSGNKLPILALLYLASSAAVNTAVLILLWRQYKEFIPNRKFYKKEYIKPIFDYGFKLFLLQISSIILFTTDNMIITQLFSPSDVTPYSITYSCLNAVNAFFGAVVAPFWSRYTIEDMHKNYSWIKKGIRLQLIFWGVCVCGMVVLGGALDKVYNIWLGRSLNVPVLLLCSMVILKASEMFTNIFSNFLNGVSHVNVQVIVSVSAAVVNIPLSVFLASKLHLGTAGVCLGTLVCQLFGCVILPVETFKYIKNRQAAIADSMVRAADVRGESK